VLQLPASPVLSNAKAIVAPIATEPAP